MVSPSHLVLAARQGDLSAVKALLDADPTCAGKADERGETALQLAAHQGNLEMCIALLASGGRATLDMGTPAERLTPLHLAASRNREDICRLLIDGGARLDVLDARAYTPLHHAAFKGNAAIAALLIAAKAPCNPPAGGSTGGRGGGGRSSLGGAGSSKAETPLSLAAFMRHTEVAIMLMRDGDARTAFVTNASDKAWVEEQLAGAAAVTQKQQITAGSSSHLSSPSASRPASAFNSPQYLVMDRSPKGSSGGGGSPSILRPSNRGGTMQPSTRSSQGGRRHTSDSTRTPEGPTLPVFVAPPLLEADDADALRYRGAVSAGGSGAASSEPAVWFMVHGEETPHDWPEYSDDDVAAATAGSERPSTLYRAPAKLRTAPGSLPALVGPAGGGVNTAALGSAGTATATAAAELMLHLYPFSYLGMPNCFLIDQERRYVYFLDPDLQQAAKDAQARGSVEPRGFAPLFIGRNETSASGGDATDDDDGDGDTAAAGYVRPLRSERHCMQMEGEAGAPVGARRCLRQASTAAAWLGTSSSVVAEIGGVGRGAGRTSLLVPLCAVLGVHEVRGSV